MVSTESPLLALEFHSGRIGDAATYGAAFCQTENVVTG
jgi:hypothetical protein